MRAASRATCTRISGATEDERQTNLATFKAWVGKDAWVLNRLKARGKVPGVSKEALEKIQVKY